MSATQTMTVTAAQLDDVRAAVDGALDTLKESLRKLNHQVSPTIVAKKCLSGLLIVIKSVLLTLAFLRSGQIPSSPTKNTRPTMLFAISSKHRDSL